MCIQQTVDRKEEPIEFDARGNVTKYKVTEKQEKTDILLLHMCIQHDNPYTIYLNL